MTRHHSKERNSPIASKRRRYRPPKIQAPGPKRSQSGYQVIELIVVLAVVSTITLVMAPSILGFSARWRVDTAARELKSVLFLARSYAVKHSAHVGLKFFPEQNPPAWGLFRDGDGDGLRTNDIRSGTDPVVMPVRPLQHFGPRVGFGFRSGPPPQDPGRPGRQLDRLNDPIRFNRSDIASFSPLGTSTPGSLYLTDGGEWQLVVRLDGRTGRVRILTLDPETEEWH